MSLFLMDMMRDNLMTQRRKLIISRKVREKKTHLSELPIRTVLNITKRLLEDNLATLNKKVV